MLHGHVIVCIPYGVYSIAQVWDCIFVWVLTPDIITSKFSYQDTGTQGGGPTPKDPYFQEHVECQ